MEKVSYQRILTNKNFGLTQNSIPLKTENNQYSEFVKETERYDTNFRESAASRVRQETGKRETSYKDSTSMNTMENYKNVHMFTATVFCRSSPMNNMAVLIMYLQFYKSFPKETEKPKIYGTIFFFLFLQYMKPAQLILT